MIQNMGEFSEASGRLRTVEKKNHAGQAVFGRLNPDVPVRFFTVDENADKIARIGIDERQTVGNFVGERYSADVLARVINDPSNPLGFDPAVLPYAPTQTDRLDCCVVDGLWSFILEIHAKLEPPVPGPVTTSTPPPAPPNPPASEARLAKLLKLEQRVAQIADMADKVQLRPNGGGVPSQTLLTVRQQLRKALEAAAS